MSISTSGVSLKWGPTPVSLSKVIEIKDFPDLGSAPESIETTTLSDKSQTYIPGILSQGAMEFTANYMKADYSAVSEDTDTDLYYALEFGENGSEGIFMWRGRHFVWVSAAGVNSPVEMKISVVPSTAPSLAVDIESVTLAGLTEGEESEELVISYTDTPGGPVILAYKWQISDAEDGEFSDIAGAISATYMPISSDVGKFIRCQVTATGFASGTVASNAQEVQESL